MRHTEKFFNGLNEPTPPLRPPAAQPDNGFTCPGKGAAPTDTRVLSPEILPPSPEMPPAARRPTAPEMPVAPERPSRPTATGPSNETTPASDRVAAAGDVGPKPTATKPKVRVEAIRVMDLPAFARAAAADPVRYAVLPIPPMRADAQAKNPLARPDDIGLIVGYVGDRCAGFLGLLPGAIEFQGRRHPMSSLTGFYVAPGDRTSGLGTMLPLNAIGLGRDLYVCRMSADSYSLFTQLGFWPARPQRTLRLQLSRFRKLKGIPLRMLGRSVDATGSQEKWTLVTEARVPMTASWTDGNGHPEAAAPAAPAERPRFVRDEAVINWMVRNPWIGEDSHVVLPYAFS